jgi:hypothetical protein
MPNHNLSLPRCYDKEEILAAVGVHSVSEMILTRVKSQNLTRFCASSQSRELTYVVDVVYDFLAHVDQIGLPRNYSSTTRQA